METTRRFHVTRRGTRRRSRTADPGHRVWSSRRDCDAPSVARRPRGLHRRRPRPARDLGLPTRPRPIPLALTLDASATVSVGPSAAAVAVAGGGHPIAFADQVLAELNKIATTLGTLTGATFGTPYVPAGSVGSVKATSG